MKSSNSKLVPLTIGIAGLAWVMAIFIFAGVQEWHISCGGTLVFGIFAIVVAIIYLMCFRYSPGRQAEEEGAISIIVTVIYVITALIGNTVMVLTGKGGFTSYLLIINVIINVCFVMLILYVERSVRRLAERLNRTEQKTAMPINISSKLGALLSVTEDKEIHRRLLKLKEAVDYGGNITTANTAMQEQQLVALLDELMKLIVAGDPEKIILSKLQQIEQCWKIRSSAASSIK